MNYSRFGKCKQHAPAVISRRVNDPVPTCPRLPVCESHSVQDFRGNLPAVCNGLCAARVFLAAISPVNVFKNATGAVYPWPVTACLCSAASACASQCKQNLGELLGAGGTPVPPRRTESEGWKSVAFGSPSSASTRFFLDKTSPFWLSPPQPSAISLLFSQDARSLVCPVGC